MATTAQFIIDAAIASALANDQGQSDIANDSTEILTVINLRLQQFYTFLGMPPERGGPSRGDFFARSSTITISAATPPAAPASAFSHEFETALGVPVSLITRKDLLRDRAELPPAVIVEDGLVRSALRNGDPIDTDVLTVHFTPVPGDLTVVGDFIGATTPADATTSLWPDKQGNRWLIGELRRYFAIKRGAASADEMADIDREINVASSLLASFVGGDASTLISLRD